MPPHSAFLQHLQRLVGPSPADAELLRRWTEQRDEDAFTALVARHGRMVLGVCRRVLGNSHDAEDAFQAVFLILARKAGTLRHPEALAGWLHGVAVRLAGKARAAAARRPCTDADSTTPESCDPHPDPLDVLSGRELLSLIDREIAYLPEVYRLPLLLCDVEGRTQPEAARLLGWTLGSLRGRLSRGRTKLRKRLLRRGVAPETLTVLFAAGLMQANADAAVPLALAAGVSRLAVLFSTCPTSPTIPIAVAALARVGLRGMILVKLKLLSAVLLTVGTLTAGAGLLARNVLVPQAAEERTESKPPSTPAAAAPPRKDDKPRVRLDQAGDPLPDEAIARLGTIRFRHGGTIVSLAFADDGKKIISESGDSRHIWDVSTGKKIQRLPGQTPYFESALSPDGKLLAVPDGSYNIELRDPAAKRPLHILKGHTGRIFATAFFADGKTLVSSSDDKTIRFWDVATGKQLRQIKHNQSVGKIALSPDGKLLASLDLRLKYDKEQGSGICLRGNLVHLWDTANGKELRQLAIPVKALPERPWDGIASLRFAPDGKTLLTGSAESSDGVLRSWDTATGREVRRFSGFAGLPSALTFAPDGKSLAVVDGATIRLIRLSDGTDLVKCRGHRGRISSIVVTPDCQTIVTASADNTLRSWDPKTGRELHQRAIEASYFRPSQLRVDGRTYINTSNDRTYRLYDLASGKELAILRGHQAFFPFVLSPDRKTLVSENADKMVRLLDPATGKVRHTLMKVKHWVNNMSFTKDGRTLVVWDADRVVTVWDIASGKKRGQFDFQNEGGCIPDRPYTAPYSAALSPDGRLLAISRTLYGERGPSERGNLPVLETTTGKVIARFATSSGVGPGAMIFSPDGKSLAWSIGEIHLGEIATGRERHHFTSHHGGAALAFSLDGKMLISGSHDTTALVWDLTGRLTSNEKSDKPLSVDDVKKHWHALAAEDAAAGYRAIQTLAADPEHSIPYLRPRLHPVAAADEERLKRLLADLDSEQLAVREKATAELEKLGEAALHAMRKVIENQPTLEARRRLEPLIEKQQYKEWKPSAEGRRLRRALEVLERAGTAEARRVLTTLAGGAPGAWLTLDAKAALERLAKRP